MYSHKMLQNNHNNGIIISAAAGELPCGGSVIFRKDRII